MCTEEQHHAKMTALARIETLMRQRVEGRPPIDFTYNVSATKGFILDYKNRKHIYLWTSATGLSLDLKELGTLAIAQCTWVQIDFKQGFEIFATSSTTTDTSVFVRSTDENTA